MLISVAQGDPDMGDALPFLGTEGASALSVDEDRYERLECIGRGSFGDVYRG